MPTINDEIQDDFIAHQIRVIRLSTFVGNEIKRRIKPTEAPTNAAIADELPNLTGQASRRQNAAYDKLEKKVRKTRGAGMTAAAKWNEKEAVEFVQAEFDFVPDIINDNLPFTYSFSAPTTTSAAITAYAQFNGLTLKQWHTKLADADVTRIMQAVRQGVANGQTTRQIIAAVKGAYRTTENGAEMLARTTTNGLNNAANKAFYEANTDVIAAEVYSATLDARTSAVCRGLDGKRYEVGQGPQPPLHPNCRSVRVPVVDGEGLIGDRPSVGGTNFRAEARKRAGAKWSNMTTGAKTAAANRVRKEYGKRIFGSVPASTTYEQFLKRQPAAFQNEVLGKRKAQLWRKGELSFDQMFDSRTYRELSLADIRRRYGVG